MGILVKGWMRGVRINANGAALIGIVAVAVGVRFAGLGSQSYWYDETLTVALARAPFGLTAIGVHTEAEPPLYFALTWVWARLFGDAEYGLRSLSGVCGVLTVPVMYGAARTLFDGRVALIAALLTAVSPAMIAFSQEARSYALYVLLCAVSLWFLARAVRDGRPRDFAGWAVASALALLAHYFAIFFVVPEAGWILARASSRRAGRLAVGGFGLALLAVLPLALYERRNGVEWIANTPLRDRLKTAGHFLFLGPGPGHGLAIPAALIAVAAAIVVVRRGDARTRQSLLLILWIGGAFVLLPIAAAIVGSDYVLDRNLLAAFLPLALVVAAGIASTGNRYIGSAIAFAICALLIWSQVKIITTEGFQRDDWRAVAHALGPPTRDRVLFVLPGWQARPLAFYDRALRVVPSSKRITEAVTITYTGPRPRPGPHRQAPLPPALRPTRTRRVQRMILTWFRSPMPVLIRAPWYERIPTSDGPVGYSEATR